MPIRFRCTHCDQLMGIARRKAGTRVRCPSCQGEVEVPNDGHDPLDSPPPLAQPGPLAQPAPAGVFDRDDFDVLLQGAAPARTESSRASGAANGRGQPAAAPPPLVSIGGTMGLDRWAAPPSASGAFAAAPAGGVVLSPLMATILTVAAVLLVASAFGAGVLVGRALGG